MCMALLTTIGLNAADDEKPKYTIEEVMKKAHGKNNLPKKLAAGTATDKEKEDLVAYYEALGKNKPPKGDAEGWKKKTDALLTAAKGAVKGDKDELAALKKAVNCKACHDVHKPEE